MATTTKILLGSPDYELNENTNKAKEQFQRLKEHIEAHNIAVDIVPGDSAFPDSVFIANSAIIVNDFAIMAKCKKPLAKCKKPLAKLKEPGKEPVYHAEYLKTNLGLRIWHLPEEEKEGLYFEGSRDVRWSHNNTHIWFGYNCTLNNRSTLRGINAVINILKEELGASTPLTHILKICDKSTPHLDLAFLPLPNGRALYSTLATNAVKEIEKVFGPANTIKVPAKYFTACGSVCITTDTILIPKLPFTEYRQWMYKATKMKVEEININQFNAGINSMILQGVAVPL